MSRITTSRKTAMGMIGAALAGTVLLSGSVFAVEPLAQGYQVAAADTKTAEGKCGEGKCGSDSSTQAGKTGNQKAEAEGKCGEGKCGEGKCGDASFSKNDTDKDGFVSRAEFLKVVPSGQAAFEKIDADHNGLISEAEAYEHLRVTYTANGKETPKNLFENLGK